MEQLDYMEIDDPEVFEALNNTLRTRILRRLGEPKSIREVAEELNMPPTRLYYHVNLMEDVGIIEVVETRKVGAMLQKIYQAKARGFRPSPKLTDSDLEPQELAKIMSGVVLDGARVDAIEALTRNFDLIKAGEADAKLPGSIGRTLGFFNREQAQRFSEKLQELIEEEFDQEDDRTEGDEYSLTYVFFPIAGTDPGEGE
jgi:DNA-binding transcriptional ArsR family regulator